jgi:predicted RNA-binding Zn-ribbon protein involved in translation (DUF1610 family)
MQSFTQGTLAGGGTFRCESCGVAVALHERDLVPSCPRCDSTSFTRSSLFAEHGRAEPSRSPAFDRPAWLAGARAEADPAVHHLAWMEDGGTVRTLVLAGEWTRLGRSLACDAVFDDPTVSRRHALVHRPESGARVLDDRSLNGVFVNGERVEERDLADGDELAVGRFRLYYLAALPVTDEHPIEGEHPVEGDGDGGSLAPAGQVV